MKTKTKHTPTPWRHFPYAGSDFGICGDEETHKDLAIVRGIGNNDDTNAAHIVECVNSHDTLVAERDEFRRILEQLSRLAPSDEGLGGHAPAQAYAVVVANARAALAQIGGGK
jgi:hypothetical protein